MRTGCDRVLVFRGKGKRTAWRAWEIFDDETNKFGRLSETPAVIGDPDMKLIEAFVAIMHDKNTTTFALNEARFEMIARKQRQYDAIPPTRAICSNMHKGDTWLSFMIWDFNCSNFIDFCHNL